MKCLCAIHVDRNQQTFLEQMTSFVGQYDVIYHSLPIISQYLMMLGGLTALTMWPANDCLQERSDHAWCRPTDVFGCKWYYAHAKMKPCFFPPWDRSCVKMADRFASQRDFSKLKNKLSDRMCLADRCLADQLFLCSPLKHQDIFRLPSSIIIVNCLSLIKD